jgi:hypothetical protein
VSYRNGDDTFNNKLSPTKLDRPYEQNDNYYASSRLNTPALAVEEENKSHGLVSIDHHAPAEEVPPM